MQCWPAILQIAHKSVNPINNKLTEVITRMSLVNTSNLQLASPLNTGDSANSL